MKRIHSEYISADGPFFIHISHLYLCTPGVGEPQCTVALQPAPPTNTLPNP
ncbi:hypothetical protein [Paenibacillus sp. SYP-B4298]|uniref:hypothetical protein n=1 Tax=Paenibacillus sp. SYP-B4298 TaxID=2996034 RepID=UPI0022DDEE21|nr:hypothetical protein [Paenibacillus sp. SYP-B4298]